ncbi:hypothetical protein [Magnetococcus marinus]|uniref:hypothetical protein n=1 Tax=Magnetococcus marinus TaxID=1124597 RepID=UPI00003C5468|nr:hypothetical protein [Magnetococcus marinus]
MEDFGSLLLFIGVVGLIFWFFYAVAGLILRIFGPVAGSLILLIITFGMFGGGGDDC